MENKTKTGVSHKNNKNGIHNKKRRNLQKRLEQLKKKEKEQLGKISLYKITQHWTQQTQKQTRK